MIKINDYYFIKPDVYSYALCRVIKGKDGKERTKTLGYYSNIKACIKALANFWAREKFAEEDTTLPEFAKAIIDKIDEYEAIVEKCKF